MNQRTTLASLIADGKREMARSAERRSISRPPLNVNELAARLEAELLWRSDYLVTLFTRQECMNCGGFTTHLRDVMVEQSHLKEPGARRFLRSVGQHPLLPRKQEVWVEHINTCYRCYSNESPIPKIVPFPLPDRPEREEE